MIELLILIGLLAVVVLGATAVVVARRRPGPELEPPPERTLDQPVAVDEPPVAVDEPPVDEVVVPDTPADLVEAPGPPPKLRDRLGKARSAFGGYLTSVLGRSGIDQDTWDDLEEALITADIGVRPTTEMLDHLRLRVKDEQITEPDALLAALKTEMSIRLADADRTLNRTADEGRTAVWLIVGVNGVGKTTSIGKMAARESADGRRVLLAAGDTFRAAAAEQLETWAERAGADYVRGAEGADPSSVVFDGVQRAASKGCDLVLADTAGRLHNKVNLMEELSKVRRVADREPGQVTEVLLVIDATTGQNGLMQAKQFAEAAGVTGVVLTKLDGSARGGIVVAIQAELGIPVKLVGVGETISDLIDFDPGEFVDALFAAT
ncbi:MAG: signal recognition particle-docking protein FtsY [Acidimicrobiales bacterium]